MTADESLFTGWVSYLAGIFVLASFFNWYRKRDALVSSMVPDYSCCQAVDFLLPARSHSYRRVFRPYSLLFLGSPFVL